MNKDPLSLFTTQCRNRIDSYLDQHLPAADLSPARLHHAMRYAVLGGGKRIRPILVYATAQAAGLEFEQVDGIAAAIELIHAYSLVHDDLPCMDDDDLRRSRPTCHIAFDEATALLAGDALQSLAFLWLATDPFLRDHPNVGKLIELLARAAGSRGMAGGQMLDLASVPASLNLAELENLHIHKTGALIRACVSMPLQLSLQQSDQRLERYDHYAKCIGLAFQIQDDILDITGDIETLGKSPGQDVRQEKNTYPALLGLDGAQNRALMLLDEAEQSLQWLGDEGNPLRWIASYIVHRDH